MSPLRPTSTSSRSSAKPSHISPLGVAMCALATLVTVPVVLSGGAASDAVEVAVVAVATTADASDQSSASQLDAEIEIDGMFDAGARVDDLPDAPVVEPDPGRAAAALVDASGSAAGAAVTPVVAEPQSAEVPDDAGESPQPSDADRSDEPPATAPPATTPDTTAPPATTPPTTAAPAPEAPATQPPAPVETEAAPEPEPVAEAPQAAAEEVAPSQPTAEQWAALRRCESGGNYTIVSSNGLYHGAYQFYQPTWDGLARIAGRTDLVGVPPSQAAPADQDALAVLLWQRRGNQPWPHCGVHLPAGP